MGKALDGRVHLVEVGEGSGRIWSKAPCVQESGLMSILRPIAAKSPFQDVRFTIQGDKFVLADRRGNLYAFHVLQNRYNLVIRSGSTPTALAFSPSPKTYCVIASKDKVIRVVDIEVATVVATLKGHRTPVTEVSFHPLGQYMVSTSSDRVVVWDTRSWKRRRTLDTHDICQALFSPTGASILTCVGSEGIVAWDSLKFRMQYRLSPPKPGSVASTDLQRFAVSSDGRYVIGAGNSPNLFLWEANIVTLLRIAVMPVSVTSVRQLAFLPESDVAIVLGDDGSLLMYNVISLRVLISIAEPHKLVTSFAIGSGGRYAACTMSDGTVGLYDLDCAFSAEEQSAKRRLEQGTPKEEVRRFLGSQKVFGSEQVRPAPSQPARSLAATDSDVPSSSNADVDGMDPARDRDQDCAASDAERVLSRSSSSKLLQPHKLKSLLRAQGEYPERYRLLIWRFLLRIPENRDLYGALTQKGIHEAYVKLDERYPLKERRLFRRLQRVLSCLAHWSPLFSEVEFLPSMVFPFVRLFPADDAVVFEIVCTLLLNWCTRWFEFFPNPPMTLLQQMEALLKYHDGALLKHLVEQGVESSEYAWPILQTLFTEILGKQDWLVLLDHLLSNRPTLIVYLVVAYLKRQRAQIVQLHSRHNIAQFVHQQNPIELPALLRDTYAMRRATPEELRPKEDPWTPLLPHTYPVFEHYPKFVVDYQLKERERIRIDEEELALKRTSLADLQQRADDLQKQRDAWKAQQDALRHSEQQRRQNALLEEEARLRERQRIDRESQARRKMQINAIADTLATQMQVRKEQRAAELKRIEDEEVRQRARDEYDLEQRLEEEALLNLEFQMNQKLQEMSAEEEHGEAIAALKAAADAKQKQREVSLMLQKEQWRSEDEERRLKRRLAVEQREKLARFNSELRQQREAHIKALEAEATHEQAMARILRERKLRHLAQDELGRQTELELDQRRRDELLAKQEALEHEEALTREARFRENVLSERERIVDAEKRRAALETEKRAARLSELEAAQRQRELADEAQRRHRDEVSTLLKEEKEMQAILASVDEEARRGRELEIEIRHRDERAQEQLAFAQVMNDAKRSIVADERERYKRLTREMRERFRGEEEALEQRHKDELDKIVVERERVFHDKNEDWRSQVRADELERIKNEHVENRRRKRELKQRHDREASDMRKQITEAIAKASNSEIYPADAHLNDDGELKEDDSDAISKKAAELVREHQRNIGAQLRPQSP